MKFITSDPIVKHVDVTTRSAMTPSKTFFHQNGSGEISPRNEIMEKSHWIWNVLSIALITGILFMIFFPGQAQSFFKMFF